MSDNTPQREMTLAEWVGRLATHHTAYQEYIGLTMRLAALERELDEARALLDGGIIVGWPRDPDERVWVSFDRAAWSRYQQENKK